MLQFLDRSLISSASLVNKAALPLSRQVNLRLNLRVASLLIRRTRTPCEQQH